MLYQNNQQLIYQKLNDAPMVVETDITETSALSLAIHPDNRPRCLWYSSSSNELVYSARVESNWWHKVLVSDLNSEPVIDMAFDIDGNGNIVFRNTETHELNYLAYREDDWHLAVVSEGVSSGTVSLETGNNHSVNIVFNQGFPVFGTADMSPDPGLSFKITMPFPHYTPGVNCQCDVTINNPTGTTYFSMPFFCILSILDTHFFFPSFSGSSSTIDFIIIDLPPGETNIGVIPQFTWPSGVGSFNSAYFYTGVTDQQFTRLLGDFDVFEFSWSE